jgi:hypothetical protein
LAVPDLDLIKQVEQGGVERARGFERIVGPYRERAVEFMLS